VKKTEKRSCRNIDFILADAQNLPFLSESFDVVTSCFAFAFMNDPQKAAGEMTRVAKQGGKVASVEYQEPPFDFWSEQRKKANIHDFTEEELGRMLRSSGLNEIRSKSVQVLHGRKGISEKLIEKSQIVSGRIMGLSENASKLFSQRIGEESIKLPKEKRSWLPILCVGVKDQGGSE
jgi:ubiquinone/menaquinone biosynthesis C-methylase UbiE